MKYKWGCIGCGHIANEMAQALAERGDGFYAVSSRTYERAVAFADRYGIERTYATADEMLLNDDIDIIYIATPHNSHIEYLRKSLMAGKHVLCEKAITLNSSELDEALALAEERGLVLAEAMTIFHCPVYRKLDEIISSGRLGALKAIQVNLGSSKEYDMTNRFFNMELAGGAMLDIGVYALSFARYFMSECPDEILSQMVKAPTGADEQVNIILKNSLNEMATVTLSLVSKLPKLGVVGFENGYASVDNYNRTSSITITDKNGNKVEEITDNSNISALVYEVIDMENAVESRSDIMKLSLTRDVMRIMTRVRYEHKMLYPEEM